MEKCFTPEKIQAAILRLEARSVEMVQQHRPPSEIHPIRHRIALLIERQERLENNRITEAR